MVKSPNASDAVREGSVIADYGTITNQPNPVSTLTKGVSANPNLILDTRTDHYQILHQWQH